MKKTLGILQQKIEANPKLNAQWSRIPHSQRESALQNIYDNLLLQEARKINASRSKQQK